MGGGGALEQKLVWKRDDVIPLRRKRKREGNRKVRGGEEREAQEGLELRSGKKPARRAEKAQRQSGKGKSSIGKGWEIASGERKAVRDSSERRKTSVSSI